MNKTKQKFVSGFTILELLLAMGLLAVIIVVSGVVFKKAVDSHRVAKATSEISQKLQAITDQIDKDFASLRKDGEIFLTWLSDNPGPDNDGDGNPDSYERLDRIWFFVSGDFTSYNEQTMISGDLKYISGNLALVCYTFARDADDVSPFEQSPNKRVLTRTQHIFTADSVFPAMPVLPLPATYSGELSFWNDFFSNEYMTLSLDQWLNISVEEKVRMLSITTMPIAGSGISLSSVSEVGPKVDPKDPSTIHMFLGEGVGSFEIQGWSETEKRWVPMYDPDGDADYTNDSDFNLIGSDIDFSSVAGVLYPYREFPDTSVIGAVVLGIQSPLAGYPSTTELNEEHFNEIPGLGRALKFTFTLYDSLGVYKEGKTFTHIVYLDR